MCALQVMAQCGDPPRGLDIDFIRLLPVGFSIIDVGDGCSVDHRVRRDAAQHLLSGARVAQVECVPCDGSGESGTTIAANVEHLRWSLSMMNAAVRGETFEGKWKESWRLLTVDNASWDALRNELRAEFEMLRQGLQSQTDLPDQYLTGTLALLPHAAYHLGTIRQMIERVRV